MLGLMFHRLIHSLFIALQASAALCVFLSLCACGVFAVSSELVSPSSPPESCLARFQYWDQKIHNAGVQDAGAHRVSDYPYLRSNRFLASFAGEFDAGWADLQTFQDWLLRMRVLDQQGRRIELQNLGLASVDEELAVLNGCGQRLISALVEQDRAKILAAVAVPSDYSRLARALGLYPLAVPFLRLGINQYQDDIRQDYAQPLAKDLPEGRLIHWLPNKQSTSDGWDVRTLARDRLGIPQVSQQQWQIIARRHAPSWWVETKSQADLPGTPTLETGSPKVDVREATVYYQPSFTRFGDSVLLQMSYVIWFPERPAMVPLDSYAGPFDGLIWRVTLDEEGLPLVYDTIHPCGCYHYFYAAQPLQRQGEAGYWQEPKLLPQDDIAHEPLALRVASETHYLRRVVRRTEMVGENSATYRLLPYQELLSLPVSAGQTASLFDEEGLLPISSRLERYWLWPSGVKNPGAMRQWGRHATAFIGEAYFDEARLLERVFVPR